MQKQLIQPQGPHPSRPLSLRLLTAARAEATSGSHLSFDGHFSEGSRQQAFFPMFAAQFCCPHKFTRKGCKIKKKKGRLSFKYEQFLSQGNSYFGTKLKHVSRNKEKVGSCWGHSPHSRPPSAYVNSAANARKCSALTSWRFSTVHWPDPGSLSGSSLFGQLKQEQAQARHSKLRLNFTKYLWPLHQ